MPWRFNAASAATICSFASLPKGRHSDQGVPYAAAAYGTRLTSRGVAVREAATAGSARQVAGRGDALRLGSVQATAGRTWLPAGPLRSSGPLVCYRQRQ